jgi:hypothetical protein
MSDEKQELEQYGSEREAFKKLVFEQLFADSVQILDELRDINELTISQEPDEALHSIVRCSTRVHERALALLDEIPMPPGEETEEEEEEEEEEPAPAAGKHRYKLFRTLCVVEETWVEADSTEVIAILLAADDAQWKRHSSTESNIRVVDASTNKPLYTVQLEHVRE